MELHREELLGLQRELTVYGSPLEKNIQPYLERDVFVLLSESEGIAGAYFSRSHAEQGLQAEVSRTRGRYSVISGPFEDLENGFLSGKEFDSLDRGDIYGHLERYLLENTL